MALAVARAAINEVKELAQRKTAFGFGKPLRERGVVQTALARAEGMLSGGAAALLRHARASVGYPGLWRESDRLWSRSPTCCSERPTRRRRPSEVTDMMHRIAGTTGTYAKSPLERLFRDAQTIKHGFMSENRFEAVGQVYLGLEPEFMMLALFRVIVDPPPLDTDTK